FFFFFFCFQMLMQLMDKQRLVGFAEALRSHPSEIQRATSKFSSFARLAQFLL
uniref:FH2 domain-containing protein n=1 Tax=Aegilops tauschii subsp. strangulata TaxID=200361 RepID=A0A453MJS6_AEGTS